MSTKIEKINELIKKLGGKGTGSGLMSEKMDEIIKLHSSGGSGGGDYFNIEIDWGTKTCNHSASEIVYASDAGRIEWRPDYGNESYKYIVHEDKTID